MMQVWRVLVLILALLTGLSSAAQARAVKVTSGEHGPFSRLVLDFGTAVDWQLGRTEGGYELAVKGAQPAYDLTAVYDLITRDRLASVFADPGTGTLQLGLACACHAIPFEFRPGVIVIDLKDGPPPAGSGFEMALAGGEALPTLGTAAAPEDTATPGPAPAYDWTRTALDEARARKGDPISPGPRLTIAPPETGSADPALASLRSELLEQISRGAAQGVVDMADLPKTPDSAKAEPLDEEGQAEIHIGNGIDRPGPGRPDSNMRLAPDGLTAGGEVCPEAEALDIGVWGDDRPFSEQLSEVSTGLVGEFDRPDVEGVTRSVRRLLYLGFGAEARQLINALQPGLKDEPLWLAMARALDQESDPTSTFRAMAACDSPAALWSALSQPGPTLGEKVDTAAVLRAFSALPLHLRRHLGPRLAEMFLARDDTPTAHAIRDAILRAPGDAGPEVEVLDARMDLARGDTEEGESRLEAMIDTPGPATPAALLSLVEARIAAGEVLEAKLLHDLEALDEEFVASPDEDRFRRARVLGRAAAGDYEAAFAEIGQVPDAERELWRLTAENGPDSVVMNYAVLGLGEVAPASGREVAVALARRLLRLGFADAADQWMGLVERPEPVLRAEIALGRGDPAAAIDLLTGVEDLAALPLRAEALHRLGQDADAAALLREIGDVEASGRALGRSREWDGLAANGPEVWSGAARALQPLPTADPGTDTPDGPLAQGAALLEQSAETRAALEALLTNVAAPPAPEASAELPPTQ